MKASPKPDSSSDAAKNSSPCSSESLLVKLHPHIVLHVIDKTQTQRVYSANHIHPRLDMGAFSPHVPFRLHEHTLGTTSGFLLAIVHVHGLGGSIRARGATTAGRVTLHLAVISSNLSYDIVEGPVDIDS
jgi:hypothetical protein